MGGVWVLMDLQTGRLLGLETRHLESRAKAAARLDLEVSAGWVSLSSRDLWGGDALLLSTASPLEPEPERFVVTNPRN